MTKVEVTGFEITSKQGKGIYGGYVMEVEGVATVNGEKYTVTYHREEPFGYVNYINIQLPETTTENTLCEDVIRDEIQEYLNG